MECLKESSKPTFTTHLSPSFSDDVSGDDFFIEHLLASPKHAGFVEENNIFPVNDSKNDKPCFVSPEKTEYDEKTTMPAKELCFPVNDVGDLEWVSQFVDDSYSGDYALTFPVKKFPETKTETVTLVDVNPAFKNSVHRRARSKRSRTGGGVWSLRSSSPVTESSSPSSSSTSSCTSKPLLFAEDILFKPPVHLQKRKKPGAAFSGSGSGTETRTGTGQPQTRRCSHCGVQKTPQWRTGPLGAKTLCNACGVRFKSGRLLPEYRPACSPTFCNEVHSNNHRKVLEMRQKKAVTSAGAGDGGLMPPVHGS